MKSVSNNRSLSAGSRLSSAGGETGHEDVNLRLGRVIRPFRGM